MQSNCPLLARDPGLVSHLPGTQSGPADSLIRKKVRPRVPLHHSGIDGWIAVKAVRPQFGLCRSALHRGFADSQLLGQFAAQPMSAAV
jgi:hypothetical protein